MQLTNGLHPHWTKDQVLGHLKAFNFLDVFCYTFFITCRAKFKQARKLQATLVRNYDRVTYSLTGVKCRATSVAKNMFDPNIKIWDDSIIS